jgi:hypothetical protein
MALTALLSFGLLQPATAQTCFRGRPRPRCAGFVVLEFTGAVRLNEKAGRTDQNAAFLYWSGGYLQTVGARDAVGAAFKLTADSDGHRYGPVVRYRRWLSGNTSIDVAPGFFVGGQDNFSSLKFPSPTADVAFNYGDRVGLALGVDALRQRGGDSQWQGHAGVRFGTWLAPLATVALGVLIGATW